MLGSLIARCWRVLEHRRRIAGRLGMVRGARDVEQRRRLQRRERLAMQVPSPVRRRRFLDRQPGELVPKGHCVIARREHSGGEARLQLRE
jgi:hypothetical protein